MNKRLSVIPFMVSFLAVFVMPASAGEMSNTNYTIPTTVMSSGGGPVGSASFQMNSTVGQATPLINTTPISQL